MAKPDQDQPLVPVFEISINGTPLDRATASHVDFVRVAQDIGLPSMFSFVVSGTDDLDQDVPFVDDELFAIGNVVEVKLGYDDRVDTVMVGEIVALEPEFKQDGLPSLDRKSTRLNSSHLGISYAVFCLKKKK